MNIALTHALIRRYAALKAAATQLHIQELTVLLPARQPPLRHVWADVAAWNADTGCLFTGRCDRLGCGKKLTYIQPPISPPPAPAAAAPAAAASSAEAAPAAPAAEATAAGAETDTNTCPVCRMGQYCSPNCMRLDAEAHQAVCGQLRRMVPTFSGDGAHALWSRHLLGTRYSFAVSAAPHLLCEPADDTNMQQKELEQAAHHAQGPEVQGQHARHDEQIKQEDLSAGKPLVMDAAAGAECTVAAAAADGAAAAAGEMAAGAAAGGAAAAGGVAATEALPDAAAADMTVFVELASSAGEGTSAAALPAEPATGKREHEHAGSNDTSVHGRAAEGVSAGQASSAEAGPATATGADGAGHAPQASTCQDGLAQEMSAHTTSTCSSTPSSGAPQASWTEAMPIQAAAAAGASTAAPTSNDAAAPQAASAPVQAPQAAAMASSSAANGSSSDVGVKAEGGIITAGVHSLEGRPLLWLERTLVAVKSSPRPCTAGIAVLEQTSLNFAYEVDDKTFEVQVGGDSAGSLRVCVCVGGGGGEACEPHVPAAGVQA